MALPGDPGPWPTEGPRAGRLASAGFQGPLPGQRERVSFIGSSRPSLLPSSRQPPPSTGPVPEASEYLMGGRSENLCNWVCASWKRIMAPLLDLCAHLLQEQGGRGAICPAPQVPRTNAIPIIQTGKPRHREAAC